MKWATRSGVHVDRAGCAWLIRRMIDPDAVFVFVDDPAEVPADATAFDMPGVDLSHHGPDCTAETILRRYEIQDPVAWKVAEVIHEADLEDDRYDAPAAPGLDIIIRGLSLTLDDNTVLGITGPVFDGLYEYFKRGMILGREPS
ncbi:chromate resistance protein ChrB domain-containing protein [Arthrobacter sp. efr-133-TYG-118]|uniref:chromate resistance protein ChrB domain-containing protein n=1 Tax=Arthrobacter sp. efr-133-TYG-118 TaxID=3040279 RepID=UPI00254C75FD|nr:chromate resistance protein ChrB domain-containing protein [Arthrobacter sp. efr-133-TYG-118]